MTIHRWFASFFLLALLFLSGCADQKAVFQYVEPAPELVYPQPPETPRFQYLGQLTGEANFVEDPNKVRSTLVTVLKWIVGLFSSKHVPVILQRPQTGVVGDDGRIYITDVSRQAIFVFDRAEGRLHVWESAAKNKAFVAPIGITLGAKGDVLVADAELGAVIRLDRNGDPKGQFGHEVLKRPTGIARDPDSGLIYVSDTQDHNLKVFTEAGEMVDVYGKRGDGAGEFNAPTHIAIAKKQLYVTDSLNARVQVLSLDGDYAKEFGRRGMFIGDLPHPKGIAVDNEGDVYVVESYFDHLLVYNSEGDFLLPIGGTGKAVGEFYLPAGVWTDKYDRVYVSDMFNGRIQIFQFLGGDTTEIGVEGQPAGVSSGAAQAPDSQPKSSPASTGVPAMPSPK